MSPEQYFFYTVVGVIVVAAIICAFWPKRKKSEHETFLELRDELKRRLALPVAIIPMPKQLLADTEARWPSMHRDSALKRIKASKPKAKRKSTAKRKKRR